METEEDEEVYGSETLWRSYGNFIARIEQYEKSLKYYDLAVKKAPRDKKTLIDRSRARAQCCHFEGAMEDIEKAIKIDNWDMRALAERTHTNFLDTEFEQALIQNYRLLPYRKKPDYFIIGIMKCISTIEQCLGDIAGKPLRDHFLIIRDLAWRRQINLNREDAFSAQHKKEAKRPKKPKKHTKTFSTEEEEGLRDSIHSHLSERFKIPTLRTDIKFSPIQRNTSNIENYMAEKYLERMYRDKRFLKKILKDPGMNSPNSAGAQHLKEITKECYTKVCSKQDVVRTMRPFYFIKYQEAKISGKLLNRQAAELILHQENYKKEADKILKRMETASINKDLDVITDMAEKMIAYCRSKPKRLLPQKEEYLLKIQGYLRKGFYDIYRLNPEQSRWDQDKRILVCLDQPISREPSNDSVIHQFNLNIIDSNQMIQLFTDRLNNAQTPDEVCWCYHELARYSIYNKKYEAARVYTQKCLMFTQDTQGMEEWNLSLTMLRVRAAMKEHNRSDALTGVQNALQIARKRNDSTLEAYLKRMTMIIEDHEFGDSSGEQATELRKEKILTLIGNDKLKEEFAHLLRSMASQAQNRRFNLLPSAEAQAAKPRSESKDTPKSRISLSSGKSKASKESKMKTT